MTVQLPTRPPNRSTVSRLTLPISRLNAAAGHLRFRLRSCVDVLLDPDDDGDGADAPAFALKVGQDPPSLALLNGLEVELGQLGDTSRNGNLCTFTESRCNVLNRLAGQRQRICALSKNGAFSTLDLADYERFR